MATENKGKHKVSASCHGCGKPIGKGEKYNVVTVDRYRTNRLKQFGVNGLIHFYPRRTYYMHPACCD